jgi:hypothetical protein
MYHECAFAKTLKIATAKLNLQISYPHILPLLRKNFFDLDEDIRNSIELTQTVEHAIDVTERLTDWY